MTREIPERDWKLLRDLRSVALERFCQRALEELTRVAADSGKTHHERYGAVYGLVQERDRELAAALDGLRRSTALSQLARMRSYGLLTDEEMARFSPETRGVIGAFVGVGSERRP